MFKVTNRTFLIGLGVLLSTFSLSAAQNGPHVPGELLIAPKVGVSSADLENEYKAHGGRKIKSLLEIKVHHISVPVHALEKIEAALAKNPKVEFVERNLIGEAHLVPNDPGYTSQWHLTKIFAPDAWDLAFGSTNVPIAVIDSGVDPNHPDLMLVPGYNFLGGNTDTRDVLGHGTAVAGAAAALGNSGIGVSGVTWTNPVMPLVTVTSSNTGTVSDTSSAIIYAADHGARVINISLGWTGVSSTMQNAVDYAWNRGLVIVASAGNNGNSSPIYPAALNNVLAVSATDSADNLASWSTYGNFVDVAAPGVSIYTTANGGGYRYASGTSFSAPIVAGLAGLIIAFNPSLSNAQVVDLIKNNTDDLGSPGFDQYFGKGRVNAYRSLLATQGTVPVAPPPPSPPSLTPPPSGDTTPPTVEAVAMQFDGKWLNLNVSASDGQTGISKVEAHVNGKLQATDSSKPFTFKLNTKPWGSGNHSIQVKAFDGAGNSSVSLPATLSIK
jgi:subtilisin family serine protease